MTKPQHTPGPWYRDEDGFIAAGHSDSYLTVASSNCSDMDIDEREANARLIAAAPELLDALEAIIDAGYLDDGYQPTVDMARAAIAKAKGE